MEPQNRGHLPYLRNSVYDPNVACIDVCKCICIHIHIYIYSVWTMGLFQRHIFVPKVDIPWREKPASRGFWAWGYKLTGFWQNSPNIPLSRALRPLFDGIWGILKGSWGDAGRPHLWRYLDVSPRTDWTPNKGPLILGNPHIIHAP